MHTIILYSILLGSGRQPDLPRPLSPYRHSLARPCTRAYVRGKCVFYFYFFLFSFS
jgi:hypothetical protein